MKIKLASVALVCLTALFLSVPALAQGELSLEGLAEQLQALTAKVTALTERVDSIEALWINSEPTILLDGSCIVGGIGVVQEPTVLSFKKTFDEWPDIDRLRVEGVSHNPETGVTGIQYTGLLTHESIIEFWQGCEFLEISDWWIRDWDDEPFEGYTPPSAEEE